jgi:sulfate transport system ATP-binding protein
VSIEVKNLTKKFNDFTAVKNVSFSVADGEFVTLLGPSGSGKSTILRCVAGLEIPQGGQVLMGGENVTHIPVEERQVGFVFQHYALFKHMNVFENISFGLRVKKTPRKERLEKVRQLIDLVGLKGFEKRMPYQLSGGQRQRVALARALAPEPKLILLDEPFGALDTRLRKGLRTWLRGLHDKVGLTTLLVTHDQDEAFELSDRILVVNHGAIEQDDSAEMIFNKPETDFVATFVGETNRVEGMVRHGIVPWGPFKFLPSPNLKEGTKATVLFRPIDVYVSSTQEGNDCPGVIQSTRFLGSLEELQIKFDGNLTVTAQVPKGVVLQSGFVPGKQVYVKITAFHAFGKIRVN